ncbi:hypothetical protein QDS07_001039 [Morganella morganii]|nr:hypothetical protein [Morganella morganii]MBT0388164.1 hypothetical protein [Morganella morganii subsp. morganii]EKU0269289.1 hypothetical protein [Morganella morganii]ELF0883370.1 hypothetical protein [Morganella morganii]MBT0519360.1 hypothetical protein [Morganella morganii subsp. morganii]
MLAGFYFRVWLYTTTGMILVKWINNNLREPPVSADFWDSLYLAGKFLVAILLLVLSGDLIRFYRNIRRHPVITAPWHRFCLSIAALTGGIMIILLTVSYWYPFSV